jgi:hypothetical protein
MFLGPGGQDVMPSGGKAVEDLDDLLGRFAGAVNHFRETLADCAVMVNACKAQILVRKMTQLFERSVNSDLACFNLLQ